jgi:hypothetical protein
VLGLVFLGLYNRREVAIFLTGWYTPPVSTTRGGEVVSRLAHSHWASWWATTKKIIRQTRGSPWPKAEVIPNQAMNFMEGVETGWRIQHIKMLKRDSPDYKLFLQAAKAVDSKHNQEIARAIRAPATLLQVYHKCADVALQNSHRFCLLGHTKIISGKKYR